MLSGTEKVALLKMLNGKTYSRGSAVEKWMDKMKKATKKSKSAKAPPFKKY
jgi:hypothetical protein